MANIKVAWYDIVLFVIGALLFAAGTWLNREWVALQFLSALLITIPWTVIAVRSIVGPLQPQVPQTTHDTEAAKLIRVQGLHRLTQRVETLNSSHYAPIRWEQDRAAVAKSIEKSVRRSDTVVSLLFLGRTPDALNPKNIDQDRNDDRNARQKSDRLVRIVALGGKHNGTPEVEGLLRSMVDAGVETYTIAESKIDTERFRGNILARAGSRIQEALVGAPHPAMMDEESSQHYVVGAQAEKLHEALLELSDEATPYG